MKKKEKGEEVVSVSVSKKNRARLIHQLIPAHHRYIGRDTDVVRFDKLVIVFT